MGRVCHGSARNGDGAVDRLSTEKRSRSCIPGADLVKDSIDLEKLL